MSAGFKYGAGDDVPRDDQTFQITEHEDYRREVEAQRIRDRERFIGHGGPPAALGGLYSVPQIWSIELEADQASRAFAAAREFKRNEIAAIFGIPPEMLGGTK